MTTPPAAAPAAPSPEDARTVLPLESGPAGGPARPDRYHATRLRQLAHLEIDEPEARVLWKEVAQHRRWLYERLGRDVGLRVALLDYVVNVRRQFDDPQIIERTQLEAIERQAVVDPLTGLHNRLFFDTVLAREAERCRRYPARTALILLDLDHFKEVNDRFGHPVGDEVLRQVAALILEHIRAPDIACRFGGDEFAVILPNASRAEAMVVAERVRRGIEERFRRARVGGRSVPMTASIGVADTAAPGDWTPDQLVSWADRALYGAKGGGRDRVTGAAF